MRAGSLGIEVPEQSGRELDRADAIGHRVVDAPDYRSAVAGQWQDVQSPEGPGVVEPLGEQLADRGPELLVGERIRVGRFGQVPVEVDITGFDPGRAPEAEA